MRQSRVKQNTSRKRRNMRGEMRESGWDRVRMKREIEERKRETERSGREIERHHAFRSTPGRLQPLSHTAAEKGDMGDGT